MPITTLDSITALIVVDLQKGHLNVPTIHPIADIITNTRTLLTAFRQHNLPIVLVNVAGSAPGRTEHSRPQRTPTPEQTELLPELDAQPDDILITKRTWGAFTHTDLFAQLKARNVTQVVLTGVATGTGVDATARQAYELGFNVTLATDAMTDTRPESHAYSLATVFPRLGETGTTADIVNLLNARSA